MNIFGAVEKSPYFVGDIERVGSVFFYEGVLLGTNSILEFAAASVAQRERWGECRPGQNWINYMFL